MRLKELRKAKGLRQSEVAEAINCSQAVFSRYENGERTPSPDTIKALAGYFGVTVDHLLGADISQSDHSSETIRGSHPLGLPEAAKSSARAFQHLSPQHVSHAQDVSVPMQTGPDTRGAATDSSDMVHCAGMRRTDAQIQEAKALLQSMTDEEYTMALNILKAMVKK